MKFKHRSAGGWRDPQQHDDFMKITKIVKDLVVEDRTLHKYVHRPVSFIPLPLLAKRLSSWGESGRTLWGLSVPGFSKMKLFSFMVCTWDRHYTGSLRLEIVRWAQEVRSERALSTQVLAVPLSWGGFEEVVASGLGVSLQDARVEAALKAAQKRFLKDNGQVLAEAALR